MSASTPELGCQLWYMPSPADRDGAARPAICCADAHPCDARVAYVWPDGRVNLAVTDHNGNHHSRCSVRVILEGGAPARLGEGYAIWPRTGWPAGKPAHKRAAKFR